MTSDLRYTLRSLLRARWFTVAAVFTFALGIGVNVAVFSTVDRILLRPLPYDTRRGASRAAIVRRKGGMRNAAGASLRSLHSRDETRLRTISDVAVAAMTSRATMFQPLLW